jgi:aldehyde dehydrogenase (NAD+)
MSAAGIFGERRSYVAGRWVEGRELLPVENPADESTVTELSVTPVEEVERAVAEARRSFDEGVWAERPRQERARVLHALLDHTSTTRCE